MPRTTRGWLGLGSRENDPGNGVLPAIIGAGAIILLAFLFWPNKPADVATNDHSPRAERTTPTP